MRFGSDITTSVKRLATLQGGGLLTAASRSKSPPSLAIASFLAIAAVLGGILGCALAKGIDF